jgi:transcriptional regulator GlxA family with amidase domain
VFPYGLPKTAHTKPIFIGQANPHIIEAATRLIGLSAQTEVSTLLVPLVMEEIYIRLLQSHIGKLVVQIATRDSHLQKVSAAISWLQENFTEPMKVDELAERVNMSISSFHHHFKAITSKSPLQFQKELRLYEAKHLMLSKMMDVSTACMHVGYSSVSQFRREYSRFFGQPPSKDIQLQSVAV